MLNALRHHRRSLIALAAIFVASFAASEASACSSMKKRDPGACQTVCGCCKVDKAEAPAVPAAAEAAILPQTSGVRCPGPAGDCSCRSQEPVAPSPKPARTSSESRTEMHVGPDFARFDDAAASRASVASRAPETLGSPKVPIYLRNVRLLF